MVKLKITRRVKALKKDVKRDIDHEDYLACLQNNTIEKHKMNKIGSDHHVVSSYEINKTSLSCFDDKRYILDDGITSYAYGHVNSPPSKKLKRVLTLYGL